MTKGVELPGDVERSFAPRAVDVEYRPDGELRLTCPVPLGEIPRHICDYFPRWVEEAPERTMIAERTAQGDWRRLTYEQAWHKSRSIGQALLDLGLGPDRPIAILVGNSIEHALLTFAGMMAGVPVAPISPAYVSHPEGIVRIEEIVRILRPALILVQAMNTVERVSALPALQDSQWVSIAPDPRALAFVSLEQVKPGAAIERTFAAATPDAVGKVLFTSGSTGSPKGVPQTQRMMCAALHGIAKLVPPHDAGVQVDWMPWHHVMGGNHTLLGNLRDGGTLYIDDGRPTQAQFSRTVRNLKENPVTIAQYVPTNIQLLVETMEQDDELATAFFSRIRWLSYGGAALSRDLCERLQRLSHQQRGFGLPILSGYGTTETAPGISVTHWGIEGQGEIGLPLPGIEMKLLPVEERYELRVRGPNVMTGYLGRPDLSSSVFDEEGFYVIGDAVTFIDPQDPSQGLRFAGRLGENFKLSNGSWVIASEIRTAVLAAAPSIRELVVAGHGRDDIRILVWAAEEASDGEAQNALCQRIRQELAAYNACNRTATRRVCGFGLLSLPPSLGAGEVTDKGSINQRAMLLREERLVSALYGEDVSERVYTC